MAEDLGIDFAVKLPAWFATKALIRIIEGRLRPAPGLYTWEDATRKLEDGAPEPTTQEPESFDDFDVDKPILVFIHGTASSARGSFGAFLSDDAQPQWQALRQLFGDRIYAFEHRTMSDSPIDNAIELVAALPPQRPRQHRLAFARRTGRRSISLTSISAHLVARFDRKDPALRHADVHDRQQLERLARLLAQKQLRIERFVRCASPVSRHAAGFRERRLLAVGAHQPHRPDSGRRGQPAVRGDQADRAGDHPESDQAGAGARHRSDDAGVTARRAAEQPESPAAGDGRGLGRHRGRQLAQAHRRLRHDRFLYEGRDNDLVVNTDAMFHGARRDVAGYVFDQGADVSHFNYFRNPRTRAALVSWLWRRRAGSGREPFLELKAASSSRCRCCVRCRHRAGTDQPIVFVLPGIMGSHLKVGDREVWMHYLALLRGGLGDLADVDATNVRPVALVGDGYRDLCESLQDSHEVIPFAYDWRRSVTHAARCSPSRSTTR